MLWKKSPKTFTSRFKHTELGDRRMPRRVIPLTLAALLVSDIFLSLSELFTKKARY